MSRKSSSARKVRAQEASLAGPQEFACSESKSSVVNEKLIADLVAGQRVLADGLRKQQEILTRHIHEQGQALAKQQEVLTQLVTKMESKPGKPGRCYGCGQPGHYRSDSKVPIQARIRDPPPATNLKASRRQTPEFPGNEPCRGA